MAPPLPSTPAKPLVVKIPLPTVHMVLTMDEFLERILKFGSLEMGFSTTLLAKFDETLAVEDWGG